MFFGWEGNRKEANDSLPEGLSLRHLRTGLERGRGGVAGKPNLSMALQIRHDATGN